MTKLGEFLAKRAINRAAVSRMTGIRTNRLNELCNHDAKLRASELYLIAKAIGVIPADLLEYVCSGLELRPRQEEDEQ